MIEKILRFSINNRLLVILLTCMVAGYGVYSLRHLPIDAVPDITNNQVQINTVAPGLSPYDIEKQVTFPIENAIAGIPGLESSRSISRSGFSQVTAIFREDIGIYFARQQLQERLSEVKEDLPWGLEPKMGPISTGLGEVYMWSVEYRHPHGSGAEISEGEAGWQTDGSYLTPEGLILKTRAELGSYLRTVQDWIVRPQLKTVAGIAGIDSIGGYVREYHIMPDPQKMIAYEVSFTDLKEALEANNQNLGAGYIELSKEAYIVQADNRVKNSEQISHIVVKAKDGVPIRIGDIATVGIGEELRTGSASKNGEETVIGTAMMLIGANSRTVSSAVHEKLEEIKLNLPPDIIIETTLNRTKLVDATIKTVSFNLAEGALLVIFVLFLMLNNFRAALITALVIPLSMLMTSIGMVKFHISGNLMSLGALDFGLIVDGAIIITENCLRRLYGRQNSLQRLLTIKERKEEIIAATKEMIQPTVYGQAIIIIVYLPMLALHGVEGKMFHPMALTVIFALVSAFILSLTFVPALIATIVSSKIAHNETKALQWIKEAYFEVLKKALDRPLSTLVGSSSLIVGAALLFLTLGQEFVPSLDERDIALHAIRVPSISLSESSQMQLQVESVVASHPEVDYVFSKTGTAEAASDPMPPNVSDTFVMLKPQKEWPDPKLAKNALIERLEKALANVPGNHYEFTQPIEMRFNELIAGARGDLVVKIYGDDYTQLERLGGQVAHLLSEIPGSEDISQTQAEGQPTLDFALKREAISRLGLSGEAVFDVIATAIGGKEVGSVFEGDRRFDLMVRLPQELRHDLAALERLPVILPGRSSFAYVPLKEVADLRLEEGINEVNRENGKRLYIVQSNIRGRDLGSFVRAAKEKISSELKLPPGYWMTWGGQFENLESARGQLIILVPLCFFVIFFLLYTALRSVKQALLVFTGVPLAITGGIVAIWMRGIPFSISAAVGFIALSGIAVLNGLVMVTYISQLIARGMRHRKAVMVGAITRLRPVLMTALVASLGFIPMALSTGAGAEVQRPLATVIIGGLISSTLLTLFVIPIFYARFLKKED